MKKVIITDDHPLFRAAITEAVRKTLPDAEINEAGNIEDVEHALRHQSGVSLLLLDLFLPDVNGFSGLLQIRREEPTLPIIIVSACTEPATIQKAIQFGANGFIPKTLSLTEMSKAIQAVLNGEIWVPDNAVLDLNCVEEIPTTDVDFTSLTPTQLKVLVMLKNGLLNKQIASDMNISEATVKAHITAIFRKLNVRSRTQAVIAAQCLDLPNSQSLSR